MYYFTQTDPDFKLKGSRDPLGFQSIWSHAGHKLIAHLSTVSTNLVDFQILCYAHYWYKSRSKDYNGFVPFFIKLEQAFSYARKIYLNQTGFNGITVISKRVTDNKIAISENHKFLLANNNNQNILTNQRSYGIYGKYIRPFRDMKLLEYPQFNEIMNNSINEKGANGIEKIIDKIFSKKEFKIDTYSLKLFANLIGGITKSEQDLFAERILQTESKIHNQDLLFEYIQKKDRDYLKEFHLFSFIKELKGDPSLDNKVKDTLEEIENTERIVSIFNLAFTKLLNKASWGLSQLMEDNEFWDNIRPYHNAVGYQYSEDVLNKLRDIIKLDTESKVKGLISRNQEVKSSKGNNRGWLELKDGRVTILYGQTDYHRTIDYYSNYYENNYFIDNYLSLYNQILDKKWKK